MKGEIHLNRYKKIKLFSGLAVFLLSAISFTLFYLRLIYVFEKDVTLYGSYFLQYIINTFITAFAAISVVSGRGYESNARRLLSSLKLSLPRLAYLVPYYYFYYLSQSYDSLESLLNLSITSIFMIILFVLEIEIYYHVSVAFSKKADKNWDFFNKSSLFDFSVGACVTVFTVCFMRFVMNLVREGIDILIYLRDYEEFYSEIEIFYLLVKIILAFVSLFLTHLLFMLLKKSWAKIPEEKNTEE